MTILNRDKILETAKQWIDQGKFDRAIKEYEKLLLADPKDMRVKLRIAELFVKRKQINDAIKLFREVAEHYSREGFYLKAVTVYKNVLRLNPSLVEINQSLAQLYEKMGLDQDAIYQYEILANSFEQKNQFEESLKVREKLVELDTEDAGHRIRFAESLQREGKKEEALDQYEILARQYREHNINPDTLLDLYERILPHRPGNLEMLTHVVDLYYQKGDYKAALKWLEQNAKWIEKETTLITKQAEMYGHLNQLETARSKYQMLAELLLEQGNPDAALDAYCEIIVLLPEETETLRPLVEGIQAGKIDFLLEEAKRRRLHRQKMQVAEEEARAEQAQKKVEEAKPKKKETVATKSATTPVVTPAPKSVVVPKSAAPAINPVEGWLSEMRSALDLAKAYQKTGLESESQQEMLHAKQCIEKILAADPNCEEAKVEKVKLSEEEGEALFQETGMISLDDLEKLEESEKEKPTTPTAKKGKKISFV